MPVAAAAREAAERGDHHAKEGEDRYLDDGFRICADAPPSTNQDNAFERWRNNAVEAGSFAGMYGQ